MGLLLTKEDARLEEITTLISQAWEQYSALGPAVAAEKAAGIPPVSGTSQALRSAVFDHILQLYDEDLAIMKRTGTSCTQCSLCRGSSRAEVVVCCGKAPDACVVGAGAGAAACGGSLRELAGVMGMTLLCPTSLLPRPLICRTIHSILPRLTSSSRPACCPSCCSRSQEGGHQCSAHAPTHPTAAAGAGGTDRLAGMMIACMWCCVRHPRQPKGLACWLTGGLPALLAMHVVCSSCLVGLTRTLPAPAPAATKSIPEQRCDSGVEPSAPTGGSSGLFRRVRGRQEEEEGALGGGAVDSEALPLLAGGAAVGPPAGVSAPGLRRRPGQHQELE
jgi:hypothetical protein